MSTTSTLLQLVAPVTVAVSTLGTVWLAAKAMAMTIENLELYESMRYRYNPLGLSDRGYPPWVADRLARNGKHELRAWLFVLGGWCSTLTLWSLASWLHAV
jgi:hypothetical protein